MKTLRLVVPVLALLWMTSKAFSQTTPDCAPGLVCLQENTPANEEDLNENFATVRAYSLPVGAIVLWDRPTPPAGWALCNGSTAMLRDGGVVTPPNLGGRFPLAGQLPNITAGGTPVKLGMTNVPEHTHSIRTEGNHQVLTQRALAIGMPDLHLTGIAATDCASGCQGIREFSTTDAGEHDHGGVTGLSGSPTPTEFTPEVPYLALNFIMKIEEL